MCCTSKIGEHFFLTAFLFQTLFSRALACVQKMQKRRIAITGLHLSPCLCSVAKRCVTHGVIWVSAWDGKHSLFWTWCVAGFVVCRSICAANPVTFLYNAPALFLSISSVLFHLHCKMAVELFELFTRNKKIKGKGDTEISICCSTLTVVQVLHTELSRCWALWSLVHGKQQGGHKRDESVVGTLIWPPSNCLDLETADK